MPGNKYIPVKPLSSFTKGGIREHMFDLAYDVLDSLESRIIRLRDLEAFAIDILANPQSRGCYLARDYSHAIINMEKLQDARQLVDEPLFDGEVAWGVEGLVDVCKFDKLVREIGRDVEEHITRIEEYIESLGKFPDEIPSGKLPDKVPSNRRWLKYDVERELANLYGSSELPSLVASFESKSKDEVFEQAKGVLDTLQLSLTNFYRSAHSKIPEICDRAEHMFLLRRYFNPSRHDGRALTKFMADKFDRSAARLDCSLRAYILCYKDLPKEGTPAKLDIPSLQAKFYANGQEQFCIRNNPTTMRSLVVFSQGEFREPIFDEAYSILDSLGFAILRRRVLEAYVRDIINNPETEYSGPDPDFGPPFAQIMTEFMEVQLLVERCLFTGKAFMKLDMFDKRVGMIANDVEMGISLLEEFIEFALGKLPMEINPRLSTSEGIYSNIASFYGFSELPSKQKGVIETLELLLEQAKSVTLGRISRNEDSFFAREAEELGELVDLAELLALLRRYVHNTQRDGLAITKFMISKFDRSTARLDCCIRVFTVDYDKLPKRSTSTPTELDMASLPASCKGRNLDGIYVQHDRDDKTLDSLFNDLDEAYRQAGYHDAVAAMNLKDRAGTGAIRNRQTVAKTLRQRNDGGLFWDRGRSKALGADFIKNALAILHGLLRADMKTLEKLISDLKALCPNNQAPARGGLADRLTT
ncbi:hypothetical protein CEP52_000781 [Fusarium oligoseptatum]|uniref:Uncharacterized protein n=1 Tax=Fusarium oligoseptatum TaxID=2604345 RepID=A0A428ULL0_9HYPO|nr:hypothetical protein CEP52_000781 [Fusarium oligoseptatum]